MPSNVFAYDRASAAEQLATVSRVVTALVLREMKTRFGTSRLGYLWAIGEPGIYVGIFIGLRASISDATPFGTSIVLFMMTGLLAVRAFLSIVSAMGPAIQSNRSLLAYPPVKPVDVILARFLLQALIMAFVLALFYTGLSIAVEFKVIVNPEAFAMAVLALFTLSLGMGFFNATMYVLSPTYARIWGLMSLPIFLLSGVFFLPKSLPPFAQDVIEWNPVLHVVEWFRTGTYVSYDAMLDPFYVFSFALTAFAAGLLLERVYRLKLLAP